MKKMKNILFGLVALFLFAGVVNAADYADQPNEGEVAYREKIAIKRQIDGWGSVTLDVVGLDNGYVAVGYDCPVAEQPSSPADVKGLSTTHCTGFINVYDKDGNSVDGTDISDENTNYYLLGIAPTTNGYIVLGTADKVVDGTTEETTFMLELDKNLEVVYEKDLVAAMTEYELYTHVESYEDTVVIAFDTYVFVYDAATDTITTLLNNEGYLPAVAIDESGIYVSTFDTSYNTIVNKYDFDLKGVTHTTLYTKNTEVEDDMGVALDLEIVEDKLVASLNGSMTLIDGELKTTTEDMLVTVDKDLKNVKQIAIDVTIMDLVASRGDIAYVGYISEECETEPQLSLNQDGTIKLPDVKAADSCTVMVRGKYALDGTEMWSVDYTNIQAVRIDNLLGGVVVAAVDSTNYIGYTIGYEYELFEVATKTDGNGTITANKVSGAEGEVVEFTVTPNEGYTLKKVVVTNEYGGEIEFTENKFTLPSSDVEIYAEFEKIVVPNPSTGINNPYISLGLIAAMAAGAYIVLKKKKYI